jgi:ABC-type glutathione transport system ATPase component
VDKKQRVMIGDGDCLQTALLIVDEPTTALMQNHQKKLSSC